MVFSGEKNGILLYLCCWKHSFCTNASTVHYIKFQMDGMQISQPCNFGSYSFVQLLQLTYCLFSSLLYLAEQFQYIIMTQIVPVSDNPGHVETQQENFAELPAYKREFTKPLWPVPYVVFIPLSRPMQRKHFCPAPQGHCVALWQQGWSFIWIKYNNTWCISQLSCNKKYLFFTYK